MDIVQKPSKVFVSHASKDVNYVLPLIELLEDIGLKQEHLFCSSLPGYGIPNDEDIYKYLKYQSKRDRVIAICL